MSAFRIWLVSAVVFVRRVLEDAAGGVALKANTTVTAKNQSMSRATASFLVSSASPRTRSRSTEEWAVGTWRVSRLHLFSSSGMLMPEGRCDEQE